MCSTIYRSVLHMLQRLPLPLQADDSSFHFTDEHLRDNLATILFAGHDTTATTLTYALYAVAKHASVQERYAFDS